MNGALLEFKPDGQGKQMSLAKRSKMKTEHSGAKNGGGHWGTRAEAKNISKKHRRENDKAQIKRELPNAKKVSSSK